MRANEQGFTMIELLLVLLGAVLFSSIGLSAHKATDRMQLSMAARSIQTLIRQTQDQAYGEQATHATAFYTISGECAQIKHLSILSKVTMPKGVQIEYTNFPDSKLYFRGKLGPSSGGTIRLTSKLHVIIITVLPVTGRVKIYPITKK